ncbi:MAG: indole-3-glycerol phosphate synthase TrpC [Candidatus Brocadia sp. WS118]|nr:MAG: indole-3-glycerol phosphate synthase TrpC [Candidatus Brocadia sp. WS118]
MNILDDIYQYKLCEVAKSKKRIPLAVLEKRIQKRGGTKSFSRALKSDRNISIIAEIKKASPSAGIIRDDFKPIEIALLYQEGGAAAISVLTDEKYFQGNLSYVTDVKACIDLPVLRKDFIIDPYQIYEARSAGADAILLIAALLPEDEIQNLLNLAKELEMDCLIEVHTESELRKVLQTSAGIIGINNRDLATFTINLETTFRLRPLIPGGKIIVSESGIKTRAEILRLFNKGVNAILVGETLMKSNDIPATLHELLGKT